MKKSKSNRYMASQNKGFLHTLMIAVIIIAILIFGMFLGVWISGGGAYGGQRIVDKCLSVLDSGKESDELVPGPDYEKVIENEDEIDAALNELDIAHKPGYIPEDCVFDNATIIYDSDAFGTAENPSAWAQITYYYNRGNDVYYVGFDYYQNPTGSTNVVGKLYRSPVTGQEMYIDEIEEEGQFSVISIFDTFDCCVMGSGTVEEGIRSMESIYQYK